MPGPFKIVVLERDPILADQLRQKLEAQGFGISHMEPAPNLTELLQLHINEHYDLCFLTDDLPQEHLATFINDYRKLERGESCVFAQLRDKVEADFKRTSLNEIGFTTVVSRLISQGDVIALQHALHMRGRYAKIQEKIANVEGAIQLLIKEVDKLSAQKRRGRKPLFKTVSGNFISGETKFDETVLTKYYDQLIAQTEKLAPPEATKIVVPEELLKKNLPGMTEDGYVGSSERVWKKLLRSFGLKKTTPVKAEAAPTVEELPKKDS